MEEVRDPSAHRLLESCNCLDRKLELKLSSYHYLRCACNRLLDELTYGRPVKYLTMSGAQGRDEFPPPYRLRQ